MKFCVFVYTYPKETHEGTKYAKHDDNNHKLIDKISNMRLRGLYITIWLWEKIRKKIISSVCFMFRCRKIVRQIVILWYFHIEGDSDENQAKRTSDDAEEDRCNFQNELYWKHDCLRLISWYWCLVNCFVYLLVDVDVRLAIWKTQ